MVTMVNAARADHGLAPLAAHGAVTDFASGHSGVMAAAGSIWHNDDYFTKATKARFAATAVAENVAVNATTADAHARLMNSPGHRANILDGKFTHVGIAVARSTDGLLYYTQDFLKTTVTATKASETAAPTRKPRATSARPLAADPKSASAAAAPVPGTATGTDPNPAVTVRGPDGVLGRGASVEAGGPVPSSTPKKGALPLGLVSAALVLLGGTMVAIVARAKATLGPSTTSSSIGAWTARGARGTRVPAPSALAIRSGASAGAR